MCLIVNKTSWNFIAKLHKLFTYFFGTTIAMEVISYYFGRIFALGQQKAAKGELGRFSLRFDFGGSEKVCLPVISYTNNGCAS